MKPSDNTTPYKACEYDRNVRQTIPFYELIHAETIDLIKSFQVFFKPQHGPDYCNQYHNASFHRIAIWVLLPFYHSLFYCYCY